MTMLVPAFKPTTSHADNKAIATPDDYHQLEIGQSEHRVVHHIIDEARGAVKAFQAQVGSDPVFFERFGREDFVHTARLLDSYKRALSAIDSKKVFAVKLANTESMVEKALGAINDALVRRWPETKIWGR